MDARGALLLVAACGFTPGISQSDARVDARPGWLDGYRHRKQLAIDPGTTATLDNFAVAIVHAADPELAVSARDDGRDLVVTDADGTTVLSFEIEAFDGASGALAAWVRIPQLAGAQTAYLYYDGPDIDRQDVAGTWDPATFAAVWHLNDLGLATARDSTAGANQLTAAPMQEPLPSAGRAANGGMYDGSDDLLVIADPPDGRLDPGDGSFGYSFWVLVTQSATDFDMALYKGGSNTNNTGFDLELGLYNWSGYFCDGTNIRSIEFGNESEMLGNWVHLAGVFDRTQAQAHAYTNGILRDSPSISVLGPIDSTKALQLGDDTYRFKGVLDEARIYRRAVSPEWVAAEYANLQAPATFVTFGVEQ